MDPSVYEALRQEVRAATLELPGLGLAHASFGNVSAADREAGVLAIKPSGISCAALREEDIAHVFLEGGERRDGLRRRRRGGRFRASGRHTPTT